MDRLSEQIGAFRRAFGRYVDDGVGLTGEAVEALDGLFAAFQAQAKLLEGGQATPETFDDICGAIVAEVKALGDMTRRVEATVGRLQSAEIIAFRPREAL
jgi:hypothetical protein